MIRHLKIKISGTVQAVGFRPAVYSYAKKHNILGNVKNMGSFVCVHAQGTGKNIYNFLNEIKNNPPKNARIVSIETEECDPENYTEFAIIPSQSTKGNIFISPDLAMCQNCRNEFFSAEDRRSEYAFINCTDCGPRFSIIKGVPYDRAKTTMEEFEMCPECKKEYTDPCDRRYHAEPVCCFTCGPKLSFNGNTDNPVKKACEILEQGKILAVKGIGGYHIACSPYNEETVRLLRERKHRYGKPFAVMAKDMETVRKIACVSDFEEKILTGTQAPIVLLEKSQNYGFSESVAPYTEKIGLMLPYAPIHYLLFSYLNLDALVMTSGNISDEPIACHDADARERLENICHGFLSHNRKIENRIDDSVVSCFNDSLYPIRLARGFIPKVFSCNFGKKPQILACGALLKNTFAFHKDSNIYISSHIGDLEEGIAFDYYQKQINLYKNIFDIKPEYIVCDSHPAYINSEWAKEQNIPLLKIQHHKAHAVSAMFQNGLGEAINVTYDGTGYGEDGTVWGGEIFAGSVSDLKRVFHLMPVKIGGVNTYSGEKISPFKCLIPYLNENDSYLEKNNLTDEYRLIKSVESFNSFETTSMGRFFDAVSALVLNIKNISFEGEGPIKLEYTVGKTETGFYDFVLENNTVNQAEIINQIKTDLKNSICPSIISGKFHNTVALMTFEQCRKISKDTGIKNVTLSGGVFQNMFLLKKCWELFHASDMKLFLCNEIPANDGGISFGQICIALNML